MNAEILLCIIAGATILNGLFMVFGLSCICVLLRRAFESNALMLGMLIVDDEDDDLDTSPVSEKP